MGAGDVRLRLSLCALDLAVRAGAACGLDAAMSLTDDGRMVLHLPSGAEHEILGGEMDEMQSRGWVVVEDGDEDGAGLVVVTERGAYWAARWRNDKKFRRAAEGVG